MVSDVHTDSSAVYNWQGLEYASGVCPVALRITIKGKQKYHPIKIPLKIGTINVAEKKILGLTVIIPFSFEINSKTRERDWSADQTLPLI